MNTTQLHIRPARAEDRDAVFAMVATVWDGNDYIPQVWDTWLTDTEGALLVGEQDGLPVALAKISVLGPKEDWFQGMRVDPAQRGKGHARMMLRHCIALSRSRGARTLRMVTDDDNLSMQRVADDVGLTLRYVPDSYTSTALPGALQARPLPVERLPELRAILTDSPLLRSTGGLYTYGWTSYEMNEARLQTHLQRGEVLALPDSAAWAIVVRSQRSGWWMAHAEGPESEQARLFSALRRSPEPFEGSWVRAQIPQDTPSNAALAASGYTLDDHRAMIYEIRLRSDASDE